MIPYPKTYNVFKRKSGDPSKIDPARWYHSVFKELAHINWDWYEKVDGTNIRIIWDGEKVEYRGRSDRAQLPGPLKCHLAKVYHNEFMQAAFGDVPTTLYGEGYGGKIQKMSEIYGPDQRFIVFDIMKGSTWLNQYAVTSIAEGLGIPRAPKVGSGSIREALYFVRNDQTTDLGVAQLLPAEGIIAYPRIDLEHRQLGRVKFKLKRRDL